MGFQMDTKRHPDASFDQGASEVSRWRRVPRALRQGNAHIDLCASMAAGFDREVAADICRSFAHAEQAKAAYPFSPGRSMTRVEADTVVIYHHLNECVPPFETHGNAVRARMFRHVSQCLLEYSVKRQLYIGRHPRD